MGGGEGRREKGGREEGKAIGREGERKERGDGMYMYM